MKSSYLYIASPYSDLNPLVQEERYQAVLYVCAFYAKHNVPVFSPIVHWHHVALAHNLPGDYATWQTQCLAMLRPASGLLVVCLNDWGMSKGIKAELTLAHQLRIPSYIALPEENSLASILPNVKL